MHPKSPVFETDYAHGRRKHRHQCACCRRIVNAGERVVMAKLGKRSLVVHAVECAERESANGWTWRDSFDAWGIEHLRALGFKVAAHPMMSAGASKNAA